MTLQDRAVDDLIRFVLSRWIVALVAIGLASAPLHAAARMLDADSRVSGHATEATQALHEIHGQPDRHHSAPSGPTLRGSPAVTPAASWPSFRRWAARHMPCRCPSPSRSRLT
jgi:hypothetical protein